MHNVYCWHVFFWGCFILYRLRARQILDSGRIMSSLLTGLLLSSIPSRQLLGPGPCRLVRQPRNGSDSHHLVRGGHEERCGFRFGVILPALRSRLLQRYSRSDMLGVQFWILVCVSHDKLVRHAGPSGLACDGHDGRLGHIFVWKRQEKSGGVHFYCSMYGLRSRLLLRCQWCDVHCVSERVLLRTSCLRKLLYTGSDWKLLYSDQWSKRHSSLRREHVQSCPGLHGHQRVSRVSATRVVSQRLLPVLFRPHFAAVDAAI